MDKINRLALDASSQASLALADSSVQPADLTPYLSESSTNTLTNKSLSDSTTYLVDETDGTKKIQFQVSGVATATTRTWTFPDSSDTFVGLAATQVLTNKSLSDSTTFIVDQTDGTKKLTIDCSAITTATTRTLTMADQDINLASMAPAIAFRRGNILGAVTESAGVPTGAILYTGTTADGRYTLYADGRAECTYRDATGQAAATAAGSLFWTATSNTWTFPFPGGYGFTAAPAVFGSVETMGRWISLSAPSTTTVNYRQIAYATSATATPSNLLAIGRWY